MTSREEEFTKINNYFKEHDAKQPEFTSQVRKTEKGIFGTSDCEVVFEFFTKIELDGKTSFMDIGSGDGRVTIIAALFTKSVGIEFDKELVDESIQHAKNLDSKAVFREEDYCNLSYKNVDFLFSYSDQEFSKDFLEKLREEYKGNLHIYEGVFFPKQKKGPTMWIGQTPILCYKFPGDD